jgi:hypothetical protein
MDNYDPTSEFVFVDPKGSEYGEGVMLEGDLLANQLFNNNIVFDNAHVDNFGNIRVIRVY